jgi:hypothetical protein
MAPIVPLSIKPIECSCERDLRARSQIHARDFLFAEGIRVTLVRVYDGDHEAEIRCLETNQRWVILRTKALPLLSAVQF